MIYSMLNNLYLLYIYIQTEKTQVYTHASVAGSRVREAFSC